MTTPLTTDYTAADFDAPAGADPFAANTIDFPHANGQLGYLATYTMPWLLGAFDIFSSTSGPSVAIPDAPMPRHCAALARTLRYIIGAGRHGLSYIRQSEGFTLHRLLSATLRTDARCTWPLPDSASRGPAAASSPPAPPFAPSQRHNSRWHSRHSSPSSLRSSC